VLDLLPRGRIDFTRSTHSDKRDSMTSQLPNFLAGRWQAGTGEGSTLLDPVLGESTGAGGCHRP